MSFILCLWPLVVSGLLLFTFVVFFQQLLLSDACPLNATAFVVGAAWTIGLTSAGVIHVLYQRSKESLRQTARDEAAVQLAGAVAHELNQPLTVVISAAELMAHQERSPEELLALSRRVAEASHRMADVVVRLQRVNCYRAKPYVGDVQIMDLARAAEGVGETARRRDGRGGCGDGVLPSP